MSEELAAIRAIEQRLYNILRAAPMAAFKHPSADVEACVEVLVAFGDEMHRILQEHGIKPLTGPELEPLCD